MSGIHPSDEAIERIMNMTSQEAKTSKGFLLKRALPIALALAIVVGSGFGISSITKNNKEQYVSPAGYSIGGIMTVNAKSELKGGTNADGKYDWGYQICKKDITGMTKDEIKKAKVDFAKYYLCDFDEDILREEEHNLDEVTLNGAIKDNIYVNGNVMYAFARGDVEQSLTICGIDDPSSVKEIRVSNTNEFAYPSINADDLYFKENSDGEFIRDGSNVDTSKTCIEGHDISLSGERYLQCRKIEAPESKIYDISNMDKSSPFYGMELATGKVFYIIYTFNDSFFDMLGNNPNYDLTKYNDTIKIEVEFKDGKIAENILNITMDANGKSYCQLKSYNLK